MRLFADRAAAAVPGFTIGPDRAAPVAALCRALDGLPLAIELAAARVRALSVEQIAARLADRFRLLTTGDRTAPPRHRTLRATIDWSHDLLTGREQILLRRLSVFAGCSLEMAEQVCTDEDIPAGDVLDLMTALVDKSLVVREPDVLGQARRRRGGAADLRRRQPLLDRARYFRRGQRVAGLLPGRRYARGARRVRARVLGAALVARAQLALSSAPAVAESRAEEGLALCRSAGEEFWTAAALNLLAETALHQQRMEEAASRIGQVMSLARSAGDGWHEGYALATQAAVAGLAGKLREAQDLANASITVMRRIDQRWGVARSLLGLADLARLHRDPAGAHARYSDALPSCGKLAPGRRSRGAWPAWRGSPSS